MLAIQSLKAVVAVVVVITCVEASSQYDADENDQSAMVQRIVPKKTSIVPRKTSNDLESSTHSGALLDMLEECGTKTGDGSALNLHVGDGSGSCPDNKTCSNYYTLSNLYGAIDKHNSGKDLDDQFPSPVGGSRCLTLAAFLAQTWYESAHYKACKEHTAPCPPWADTCSDADPSSYRPSAQGSDWNPKVCPGTNLDHPTNGCTTYWGTAPAKKQDCWFGRGALQLSYLANYATYSRDFCDDPDKICEEGVGGWLGSVGFWQANKGKFTGSCESATSVPNPKGCKDAACHKARCDAQARNMKVLGVTHVKTTPRPSGYQKYTATAKIAFGGCWAVANHVCPGQGNSWETIICDPPPSDGHCGVIVANTVVTYNCAGC